MGRDSGESVLSRRIHRLFCFVSSAALCPFLKLQRCVVKVSYNKRHTESKTWLCFAVFQVSSVALCTAILCRLNRKENIPTVVYSPEAKAGNYTILSEPAENTWFKKNVFLFVLLFSMVEFIMSAYYRKKHRDWCKNIKCIYDEMSEDGWKLHSWVFLSFVKVSVWVITRNSSFISVLECAISWTYCEKRRANPCLFVLNQKIHQLHTTEFSYTVMEKSMELLSYMRFVSSTRPPAVFTWHQIDAVRSQAC